MPLVLNFHVSIAILFVDKELQTPAPFAVEKVATERNVRGRLQTAARTHSRGDFPGTQTTVLWYFTFGVVVVYSTPTHPQS